MCVHRQSVRKESDVLRLPGNKAGEGICWAALNRQCQMPNRKQSKVEEICEAARYNAVSRSIWMVTHPVLLWLLTLAF